MRRENDTGSTTGMVEESTWWIHQGSKEGRTHLEVEGGRKSLREEKRGLCRSRLSLTTPTTMSLSRSYSIRDRDRYDYLFFETSEITI